MEPWRTRSRRTLLDRSPWLSVEERTVELPDGRVIDDWPWVESREFANVVAVTEDGLFLVFRQTKYAVDGPTLGPVGGYLEPGEDPLDDGEARAPRGDRLRRAGVDVARAVRRRREPRLRCRVTSTSREARGRSRSRPPTTSRSRSSSR